MVNEMIGRGLRQIISAVAEALDESPRPRPQQFRTDDRTTPRQRRERPTEDQIEQSTQPEEGRRPRPEVEVSRPAGRQTATAAMLRRQLRDPQGFRHAFLVSEVIDRPRALRPYRRNTT